MNGRVVLVLSFCQVKCTHTYNNDDAKCTYRGVVGRITSNKPRDMHLSIAASAGGNGKNKTRAKISHT